MKITDRFALFHLTIVLVALCGSLLLVLGSSPATRAQSEGQLERDLARKARVVYLREIYAPVQQLLEQNRLQQALLKLEEISRRYPNQPYGLLLKGRLLYRIGATDEAIAAYAAAVRGNPDFVESGTALAAREEIEQLVKSQLEPVRRRLNADPSGMATRKTMGQLRYLQSRLAGGCE